MVASKYVHQQPNCQSKGALIHRSLMRFHFLHPLNVLEATVAHFLEAFEDNVNLKSEMSHRNIQ